MKKILFSTLLLFFCFCSFTQIVQLGQDIDGMAGDETGWSTSLNSDGSRIAIGGPFNSTIGAFSGVVRVYEFDGTSWVQLGQDIYSSNPQDKFGNSVSISDNGMVVVVGSLGTTQFGGTEDGMVRVYKFDGTSWGMLGQPIFAEAANDRFGVSVSIDGIGTRIVAGAYGNDAGGSNSGHARAFEFDGTDWIQMGSDLDGTFAEQFGSSVAMDQSGDFIIVGGPNSNMNTGVARVYRWTGSSWSQLGTDILGVQSGDMFGSSVAISLDANRVAIGAPLAGTPSEGSVQVFSFSGGWTQLGQTIFGETNLDGLGELETFALNNTGTALITGSMNNNGIGIESGHSRLYGFVGTSWVQLGLEVPGEYAGDKAGKCSISDDGQGFAVGGRHNSDGGVNAGHVRIYEIGDLGITDDFEILVTIYPNPSSGILHINSELDITSIQITDLFGRVVDVYEFIPELSLRQESGVYLLNFTQSGRLLKTMRILIQ